MQTREINIWKSIDWWVVLIYVIMVFAGWVSIYAASYNFDDTSIFDMANRSGKQLMWIGLAFCLGAFILLIDSKSFDTLAPLIYGCMLIVLVVTIFIAPDVKGSRSWLVLGPVSIQPAEFGKFATALMLGWLFNTYNFALTKSKNFIKALAIIFIPVLLIICQRETGSALVYFSLLLVLYREGMSGLIMIAGFCAILFFVIGIKYESIVFMGGDLGTILVLQLIQILVGAMLYFYAKNTTAARVWLSTAVGVNVFAMILSNWVDYNLIYVEVVLGGIGFVYLLLLFMQSRYKHYIVISSFLIGFIAFIFSVDYAFNEILEPHQQIRIKVALGIEDDLQGAGYNVNQAKIAIGSGGFWGKGLLNGTQTKLKYVPEQDTDFIFCTIGEEEGFIGSSFVLLLFLALILRLIYIAERQRSIFARVYGYCVISIFLFHLAINIGMVIGLCPVIGIPLPFFSYGGSGLWSFSILLFIYLRLDADRFEYY